MTPWAWLAALVSGAQAPADPATAAAFAIPLSEPALAAFLRSDPWWYGPFAVLLGLIPLLWGWRLIRPVSALLAAAFAALAGAAIGGAAGGPPGAVAGAILAAIPGAVLGWFAWQLNIALLSGLHIAIALYAALGAAGVGDLPTRIAAAMAFVAGLFLGWWVARPVGIAYTTLWGAVVVAGGVGTTAQGLLGDRALVLVFLVLGAIAALAGLVKQLRDLPAPPASANR